jgi:hypothetical protein
VYQRLNKIYQPRPWPRPVVSPPISPIMLSWRLCPMRIGPKARPMRR